MGTNMREEQVAIRLSKTVRAELEDAAAREGRGLSAFIRRVLNEIAARYATEKVHAKN